MAEYMISLDGGYGWANSNATITYDNASSGGNYYIGPPLPPTTPADMADDLDWLDERIDELVDFSRIAA